MAFRRPFFVRGQINSSLCVFLLFYRLRSSNRQVGKSMVMRLAIERWARHCCCCCFSILFSAEGTTTHSKLISQRRKNGRSVSVNNNSAWCAVPNCKKKDRQVTTTTTASASLRHSPTSEKDLNKIPDKRKAFVRLLIACHGDDNPKPQNSHSLPGR